jgi:hypothetical protein
LNWCRSGKPILHIEYDQVLFQWAHRVTGHASSSVADCARAFWVQVYEEKAPLVENDGDIRVLLLEETSVLYNEVQMILFYGTRALPKIGAAAFDTLENATPLRIAAVNDNLFSEPNPRGAQCREEVQSVRLSHVLQSIRGEFHRWSPE